jgi:preprotein translocase subunit SecA
MYVSSTADPEPEEERLRRRREAAQVSLTEEGTEKIEQTADEGGPSSRKARSTTSHNVTIVHHVNQALRAHKLFTRDKDYIVKDSTRSSSSTSSPAA